MKANSKGSNKQSKLGKGRDRTWRAVVMGMGKGAIPVRLSSNKHPAAWTSNRQICVPGC
jgi:hypothetical protein